MISNSILLFTTLLNACLGFFVLIKNYSKKLNKIFFLMTIALASWAGSLLMYNISSTLEMKLIWNRLMFAGPHVLPSIAVLFSYYFPVKKRINRYIEWLIISVGVVFFRFL
jgi:hypothetical protein